MQCCQLKFDFYLLAFEIIRTLTNMYGEAKLTITKAIQKKKTATPIPAALEDWVKTSGATTNPTTPEPEFNPIEKPEN